MVCNYYKNGIMDVIGGVSGTFLCIKLSMFIEKYLRVIKKLLIFVGRNSLLCMCIHLFSLDCLNWVTIHNILQKIGIQRLDIRKTIINITFVFVMLVLIKIMQKVVTKIKESKYILHN